MSLKKVVIDARTIAPVPHGMGRYVLGMAKGLELVRAARGLEYELVFLVHESLLAAGLPSELRGFRTVGCRSRIFNPSEWREIPSLLRRESADFFHSPTFCAFPRMPFPYAVTVHDLNHLYFGGMRQRLYYRTLLRRFALKADALLTVSESTRAELASWLKVPESRVRVAANAIDLGLVRGGSDESVLARHGLEPGRYFVALSNSKPHKNTKTLIDAFTRAALPDQKLVIVLESQPAEPTPAGVVILSQVSDEQARALIERATVAVSPSIYEGFGLFPVEAAALGTPVIVSDIPQHREGLAALGEGEVLWAAPQDVAGWANAMRRAGEGGIARPSSQSRSALLERYSSASLGSLLDGLYRDVLAK